MADYIVNDLAELLAAKAAVSAATVDKVIQVNDGTGANPYGTSIIDWTGQTQTARVTLTGNGYRTALLPGIDFTNSERVTVERLTIERYRVGTSGLIDYVIRTGGSDAIIISDNEIRSNPLTSVTMQGNIECQHGIGASATANALTVQGNFIHDVVRTVSINNTPDAVVTGNLWTDVYQNFGNFNDCDRLLYKDNRGEGIWANGNDANNPHSSLLGFGVNGTSMSCESTGNILIGAGRRRFAAHPPLYGFATAPKFNDTTSPTDSMKYTGCVMKYGIFVCEGIFEISLGDAFDVHHNMILRDSDDDPAGGQPTLNYHDLGAGSRAWKNVCIPGEGSDRGNGIHADWYDQSYDNMTLFEGGAGLVDLASQVVGPINGLTLANIEARLTPLSGSALEALGAGAIGTGYDFATGIETPVTHNKPRTTLTNGVVNPQVVFDGANDHTRAVDTPNPFLDFANGDQITIAFQASVDPAAETTDMYIAGGNSSTVEIRRLPSTKALRVRFKDSGGTVICQFETSMPFLSADGLQTYFMTVDFPNYLVTVQKGAVVDPFVYASIWSGAGFDYNMNSISVGSLDTGVNKWNGTFASFFVTDEYVAPTDASLSAVAALDGLPADWGADGSALTGTQPRGFLKGVAANWNDAAGLNLGSASTKFFMSGAVVDLGTDVTGLLSVTLGTVALSAAGIVGGGAIIGAMSATLTAVVLSADARVLVQARVNKMLAALRASGSIVLGVFIPPGDTLRPITLAEAKEWTRVDLTIDDQLIDSLILAAVEAFENDYGIVCSPATRVLAFNEFNDRLPLYRKPINTVSSVTYVDSEGVQQVLDPALYRLASRYGVATLEPTFGAAWPLTDAVDGAAEVTVDVGWADNAATPAEVQMATRLWVGSAYDNRNGDSLPTRQTLTVVEAILSPYRDVVLH